MLVLNKQVYKILVALVVLFHIPITFMPNQFIEFGEASYPIPVILIIAHTWLWMESRSKFINIKTGLHLYGILTGVLGFLPGMIFYLIPNIFAIVTGMILLGRFVSEDTYRKKQKDKYMEENNIRTNLEDREEGIVGKIKGMFKRGS